MMLYRVLERHSAGRVDNVLFRRHLCEWQLPQEVAMKVKFNPRHLPVVIEEPHEQDENLYRSILRILRGYRVQPTLPD